VGVETLTCARCKATRDSHDNFCRSCGHQFTVNLPVVRESNLPIKTAPSIPPSLVGSVAVLAVGTSIEWLARRFAGTAARAAGRALVRGDRPVTPVKGAALEPDVTINEVVYVRKIEVRR
jgi:hypothetical protein